MRAGGGLVISVIACVACASHCGNDSRVRVDSPDSMIAIVSDEEIAEIIQGNVVGAVDLSEGRELAVSVIAGFAGARDSRDDARFAIDTANPVMAGVGD